MQAADAVDVARAVQREPRHVEHAVVARRGAEREEALERQPEVLDEIAEVREQQVVVERVVARRHWRVGRERALRRDRLERDLGLEPAAHLLAQPLEHQERGMALVHVPDGRRLADRAQRAHAADAEHHLLADAHRVVAAVEAVRDVAIGRGILGTVGVEQDHADASDLGAPQSRDDLAARDRHADRYPAAARIAHRLDRQVARVVVLVLRVLHAVAVDDLGEIALPVQQADTDEIQALVAGGLAVVAGEHAEAARVDREAVVEAVLGAEIRDQRRAGGGGVLTYSSNTSSTSV